MRVFISWSGERSKAIAAALNEWLPDTIQDLETWMSAHDIEAGQRWGVELTSSLETTKFGILCLTPENLTAPWLLFEAGAMAKAVAETDIRVVPYCLDLVPTDIPYPLAQFQGVAADEDGTLELLTSLSAAREQTLPSDRLNRFFGRSSGDSLRNGHRPDLTTRRRSAVLLRRGQDRIGWLGHADCGTGPR